MKKHLFIAPLLASLFLVACEKEKADPAPTVTPITATANLFEEVNITIPATIPPGWVVVRDNGGSSRTIRNLNGARYDAVSPFLIPSPLPAGWVIVRDNGGASRTIQNLNGAPTNAKNDVILPVTLPEGWVVIRDMGGAVRRIRYIKGLPSGTLVETLTSTPLPSGWVVFRSNPSSLTLRKT